MTMVRCSKSKIYTVSEVYIQKYIDEFLTDKTMAVVTVIADVEDEWIWAEAELEGKDILKWISELRESCIIKLIHISTRTGSDKTWRIE